MCRVYNYLVTKALSCMGIDLLAISFRLFSHFRRMVLLNLNHLTHISPTSEKSTTWSLVPWLQVIQLQLADKSWHQPSSSWAFHTPSSSSPWPGKNMVGKGGFLYKHCLGILMMIEFIERNLESHIIDREDLLEKWYSLSLKCYFFRFLPLKDVAAKTRFLQDIR